MSCGLGASGGAEGCQPALAHLASSSEAYTRKKDGTIRWSQPLSKAWQYVKKKLMLTCGDLTLYSTRHLMADWLDNEAIAQRTRDRISATPVMCAAVTAATAYSIRKLLRRSSSLNRQSSGT